MSDGKSSTCETIADFRDDGYCFQFSPLIHRSGLNCRILTVGEIRVGDSVRPAED